VFAAYHEDLRALVAANPAWWTMQNPPLPALQDHLLATGISPCAITCPCPSWITNTLALLCTSNPM
jgi:hypothetical protein